MTVSLVRHRVADYDAWRKVYDSVEGLQKQNGVTAEAVYTTEGDRNDVLVLHEFADSATAHAFFENADLRAAMQEGGVDVGSIRLEFYETA